MEPKRFAGAAQGRRRLPGAALPPGTAKGGDGLKKKVTIREVAEAAGVSISTVHQALNGKSGVGAGTRQHIRQIAEEMGYQPNSMASSLKRKTRRVAIFLPGEGGSNRYYYPPVWKGVRDYLAKAEDMNLECTELSYFENDLRESQGLAQLRDMLREKKVDGLLTVGHMNAFSQEEWQQLHNGGVTVVLLSSDNPASSSLCCIQPDYDVIGRTMAELILSRVPRFGSILLCAGNPKWEAHSLIVRGFDAYMRENRAANLVYYDHSWGMEEDSYRKILQQVSRPDVAACCSVLSQSSVLMGRALEECGKAGDVFAVGSDLSEENIDRLRRGVLHNLIQKNPYAQGYLGTKTLVEYLTQGKCPEYKTCYVGSEVVFRSNLVMYSRGGYRSLLL